MFLLALIAFLIFRGCWFLVCFGEAGRGRVSGVASVAILDVSFAGRSWAQHSGFQCGSRFRMLHDSRIVCRLLEND